MELWQLVSSVTLWVIVLAVVTALTVFDREQLRAARRDLLSRVRSSVPFLAVLAIVLVINAQFRLLFENISWVLGWRVTPRIRRLEGEAIVVIQEFFGESFVWFFSFMYIHGYVFILVFPLVAYFLLERLDTFKALVVAYAANYGIGLICYIAFVAFGPRNILEVWQPLYETYPHFMLLTSEINKSTNVFPSLHTSLSVTVMLFAWRTRDTYPVWTIIAWVFGASIMIATMYLAIHWIVDVIAGIGLGVLAYWIGNHAVKHRWLSRISPRVAGTRPSN